MSVDVAFPVLMWELLKKNIFVSQTGNSICEAVNTSVTQQQEIYTDINNSPTKDLFLFFYTANNFIAHE